MQPTTITGISGGVAGAAVFIFAWALSLPQLGSIIVPADIQLALTIVLTWVAGQVFHPANDPSPSQKGFSSDYKALFGLIGFAMAGFLVLSLYGCGANGKIVSSTNPISVPVTESSGCTTIGALDSTFQAFAALHPGVVTAAVMDGEGSLVVPFFTRGAGGILTGVGICSPTGSTTPAIIAEGQIALAIAQIGALVAQFAK